MNIEPTNRLAVPAPSSRYILPQFEERTSYGMKRSDPYNKLFEDRIIFLRVQGDDAAPRHVIGQRRHRVVAGHRIAAAMPAHVDPQHAEAALQQGGHLFGPAAAVGGQRMGDANGRRILGRIPWADKIVGDAASPQRQQHGSSPFQLDSRVRDR